MTRFKKKKLVTGRVFYMSATCSHICQEWLEKFRGKSHSQILCGKKIIGMEVRWHIPKRWILSTY